jgi:hypothetical protein
MNKDRLILLIVIVILLLLGGYMVHFIIPWANEKFITWSSEKLTETLGTEASISSLGLTRDGKIIVKNLMIADPLRENETFFYSPRVEVKLNPLTVVKEGINLSSVYILRPMVSIYRREDGKWNIQDFGKKKKDESKVEEEEKRESKPFRLRISEVTLEGCVTKLKGVLGEEIITVLDHKGAVDLTRKKQEIFLWDTKFNTTYMTLTDMNASGKLTYERKVLSFENFEVIRDSTDIKLEGEIDFEGRDRVNIQVARSRFDLDHLPPRYGLRHKVKGNVDLELSLNGYINSPEITSRVYHATGETFDYPYEDLSCLFHMNEGKIDVSELSANFIGGIVEGDVSFFLRESPRAFRVDLLVSGIDITELPLKIPERYRTDLNGQVVAYGAGFSKSSHNSTILLDLDESIFRKIPLDLLQAQVLATGDGFHVVSSRIEQGEGLIELTGDLGNEAPDVMVKTEAVTISVLRRLLDISYDIEGKLYCSVSITDGYSHPGVRGQIVVKDGDVSGWTFAGIEGDIGIDQAGGMVDGEVDLKAFMLGKDWLTVKEAQVVALFDREGVRIDSLKIIMNDSTSVDGSGNLLYEGDRVEVSTGDLRLVHNGTDVVVENFLSEFDWKKKEMDVDELHLDVAGGDLFLRGSFSWPEMIRFEVEARSVKLDSLEAFIPDGYEIDGDLDLRLEISESFDYPEVALEARVYQPGLEGLQADTLLVIASYADSQLLVNRLIIEGEGQNCSVEGSLPLRLSLSPLQIEGEYGDSIGVQIDLGRIDLRSLKLLTDEVDFLGGHIEGDITIGGTLGEPVWNGGGGIKGGDGIITRTNTYFSDFEAGFSFQDDIFTVQEMTASLMGGGSLGGGGNLKMNGFLPDSIDFDLTAQNYMVNQVRYISSLLFDSDLEVVGSITGPEVKGDVTIQQGVMDVPIGGNGTTRGDDSSIPFFLQVDIQAENDLWIRNKQVNIEIFLDMELVTRDGEVRPIGDLEIIRGTYTYFGTIFDIDEGEILFFGSDPINPSLNVLTTRQIRGTVTENGSNVRVKNDFQLTVYGTYRDVEFDIIVYDNNGDVIPIDRQRAMTLLLANMTNEEFNQHQPISNLDVLELRTNLLSGDSEETRAQVTIGEYLMKDFFVSYSQDILDPSINNIAVEVFLGKKSSLIGQTDSQGRQYSIELRYRMSY